MDHAAGCINISEWSKFDPPNDGALRTPNGGTSIELSFPHGKHRRNRNPRNCELERWNAKRRNYYSNIRYSPRRDTYRKG